MEVIFTALICALVVIVVLASKNLWRVSQTWRFLIKGRAIMLDRARSVSGYE